MIHVCQQKAQRILNPIIDWTDEEVWEFIKEYNIPYCKLYDEGVKRLGCIGCPMAGEDVQRKEFERYPKIKQAYLRAFDEMIKERERKGLAHVWDTAEDVMKWWLFEDTESQAPLLEILESEGE